MKSIILVALALVAVAVAAPPSVPAHVAQILRSAFEQQPEGAYNFGFETDNGITREENGELKEAFDEDNKSHTVVVVRGSYSYVNDQGNTETINYRADETGYHAEGPSIPKVPARR